MAVNTSDLKFYFSGGSGNSNPALSIGGAKSSTEIAPYVLNGLMDRVNEDESEAGDTNYRIIYFQNTASQKAFNVKLFFSEDSTNKKRDDAGILVSPSVDAPITFNSQITMALYAGALNAVATTLADESTNVSPSPSYVPAQGNSNALIIGDMSANDYKAITIKRTVPVGTAAKDVNFILISATAGTGE